MKVTEEINVGVDTSKTQLDIYIRPVGEYFSVENNALGIKEALNRIKPYKPTRIGKRGQYPFIVIFKAE